MSTSKDTVTKKEYEFRTQQISFGFTMINEKLDRLTTVLTKLVEVMSKK